MDDFFESEEIANMAKYLIDPVTLKLLREGQYELIIKGEK